MLVGILLVGKEYGNRMDHQLAMGILNLRAEFREIAYHLGQFRKNRKIELDFFVFVIVLTA